MTARSTFNCSYMITNRAILPDDLCVLQPRPGDGFYQTYPIGLSRQDPDGPPSDRLFFFKSEIPYSIRSVDYQLCYPPGETEPTPTREMPPSFANSFLSDLKKTSLGAGEPARLMIYIHGLGDDWDIAISGTASFSQAVAQGYATGARTPPSVPSADTRYLYSGLVVGYSWPSFNANDSTDTTYSCEIQWHTNRGMAGASDASFASLLRVVAALKKYLATSGLRVSVVCHSEGNYMFLKAMQSWTESGLIDQVVLMAADVNNGALLSAGTGKPRNGLNTPRGTIPSRGYGSGRGIVDAARNVTVLSSYNDTHLRDPTDEYGRYHNQDYRVRLGTSGSSRQPPDVVPDSVRGVDCSAVVFGSTGDPISDTPIYRLFKAGWIPKKEPGTDVDIDSHLSYRFTPQVLWVISQIVNDEPLRAGYSLQQATDPENRIIPGQYVMVFEVPNGR